MGGRVRRRIRSGEDKGSGEEKGSGEDKGLFVYIAMISLRREEVPNVFF